MEIKFLIMKPGDSGEFVSLIFNSISNKYYLLDSRGEGRSISKAELYGVLSTIMLLKKEG